MSQPRPLSDPAMAPSAPWPPTADPCGRDGAGLAENNAAGSSGEAPDAVAMARPDAAATLQVRSGADGSFSLWSPDFREGFHSGRGAVREAQETFVRPSQLERFQAGERLTLLEVCVGTGSNLAALLEACARRGLQLDWIGLELDPRPLALALAAPAFRDQWQPGTLTILEQLQRHGGWGAGSGAASGTGGAYGSGATGGSSSSDDGNSDDGGGAGGAGSREGNTGAGRDASCDAGRDRTAADSAESGRDASCADSWDASREGGPDGRSRGRILWGDARDNLARLQLEQRGRLDLIWHDAFSPQRCPQLWTLEFLTRLATLLRPQGRWLSYCSAAAVREALRMVPLQLAALPAPAAAAGGAGSATAAARRIWSGGTLASPMPLEPSRLWRPLSPLEREHLASSAGEPYRDPDGRATAAAIHSRRQLAQAAGLARGERQASGAWRRRWGLTAGA